MPPYKPDMMYRDARGPMYGGMPPPRMLHGLGPGPGPPPPPQSMGMGMGGMDDVDGMDRRRGDVDGMDRRRGDNGQMNDGGGDGTRTDSSAVPSEGGGESGTGERKSGWPSGTGRDAPQGSLPGSAGTSLEMQLRCRRAHVFASLRCSL